VLTAGFPFLSSLRLVGSVCASRSAPATASKEDNLEYDLGNLMAFDPAPLPSGYVAGRSFLSRIVSHTRSPALDGAPALRSATSVPGYWMCTAVRLLLAAPLFAPHLYLQSLAACPTGRGLSLL